MTLSSPASSGAAGFSEPPLSPGAAPVTQVPMTQPPSRPTTPSIEAQVVRLGLMTPDQVATAMREEAETGRTFDEVVVEHGWVSAEDLARVREPDPPAAPPVAVVPDPPAVAIVPDPEPVAVAPTPEPVENLPEPAQVPIAAVPEPEPVVAAESIAAAVAAELYV